MICKKCGLELEEGSLFCQSCGAPVEDTAEVVEEVAEEAKDTMEAVEEVTEEVKETAEETIKEVEETTPLFEEKAADFEETMQAEKEPFPFQKYLLPIGVVAAILIVLAVIVGNMAVIGNTFKKLTSKPEKYYAHVEKNQTRTAMKDFSEMYDNAMQYVQKNDNTYTTSIKVKLGDKARDYIEAFCDYDMDWLEEITLKGEVAYKNNVLKESLGASIGKDSIISGEIIYDMAGGMFYALVPELSSKYLALDLEEIADLDSEEVLSAMEMTQKITAQFPSSKEISKIMNKYYGLAVDQMKDVKKKEVSVKASGVSQKVTELEVTIDGECMEAIATSVLEELKNDKDVKNIICRIAKVLEEEELIDEDADEIYENFVDTIDDALDEMDFGDYDDEVVYRVYVNAKGEITGRVLEVEDGEVGYIYTEKGSNCGFELFLESDDTEFELEGSGKNSSGKISGEFNISYANYYTDKMEVCTITTDKLNIGKLKKGYAEGKLTLQLAPDLCDELMIPSMVKKMEFVVDANTGKNQFKEKIALLYKDELFCALEMDGKVSNASKISIPGQKNVIEAEDEDDMMDWIDTIDFDAYLKKLKKTKLPEDVLDLIEELLEEVEDMM